MILLHHPNEHFALAAKAFGFLHGEARILQTTAHKPGTGKSGERRPRARQAGHRGKQLRTPHIRVFGRRKPVEEPGINLLVERIIELVSQFVDITEPDIEGHSPAVQQKTMAARDRQWPLGLKLLCPGR